MCARSARGDKTLKDYDKTEDDQALQSVGQIIGEVLRHWTRSFIVKASSGPRYVVGCRKNIDTLSSRRARASRST